MNVPNMKTSDAKEKKFRQLSDEELEKVTGGARGLTGIQNNVFPEECKDPEYRCSHSQECNYICSKVD